jgi:hypothetical protein
MLVSASGVPCTINRKEARCCAVLRDYHWHQREHFTMVVDSLAMFVNNAEKSDGQFMANNSDESTIKDCKSPGVQSNARCQTEGNLQSEDDNKWAPTHSTVNEAICSHAYMHEAIVDFRPLDVETADVLLIDERKEAPRTSTNQRGRRRNHPGVQWRVKGGMTGSMVLLITNPPVTRHPVESDSSFYGSTHPSR